MVIKRRLVTLFIGAMIIVSLVLAGLLQPPGADMSSGTVAIVRVEGTIAGGNSGRSLFGGLLADSGAVVKQLQTAAQDADIKAVVLRINSPGGTAAAAQEVAAGIAYLQKAGKVVVASLGDVAASGGYWVASACDRIVANPATITGSIGVLMEVSELTELYEQLGIKFETIKSGPHKDMGSPTRPLTDQERRILQGMVDDIYLQFLEAVAAGRALPLAQVQDLADGRTFTGRQAHQLGLVDDLGTFTDAIETAASLAGLADGYQVRELGRRPWWDALLAGMPAVDLLLPTESWRMR